jgi:TolA-binding protein
VLRSDVAKGNTGGGTSVGGDAVAQLISRVQAMEEQVRQLRGRIDETQNLVNRQTAELSKRIEDLTFQLNLQGRGGAPLAPMASAPVLPPVREVAPRPFPDPVRPDPVRSPEPPPRPEPAPKLIVPVPMPSVIPPPPAPPASFTFNQTPEPMRDTPPKPEPPKPVPQVQAAVVPPQPVAPAPRPAEAAARPVPAPSAPEPVPMPAPQVAAVPIPADGKRTPELALQEGHAALARRDYVAAEKSAREVMGNRASPRAYDGQFLLAESLTGQKQYAQAAIAFDDAYNRSHKGRYAQEALVGLAQSLTAINEKKAACDTLGRLRTEFPQVRADLKDTITKTNDRAGCGR